MLGSQPRRQQWPLLEGPAPGEQERKGEWQLAHDSQDFFCSTPEVTLENSRNNGFLKMAGI